MSPLVTFPPQGGNTRGGVRPYASEARRTRPGGLGIAARLAVAARIAFVVGMVVLVAWRVDLPTLAGRLAECSWPLLAAAGVANALSAAFKAVTWQGLLAGVRGVAARLGRLDLVGPLFVGALVNSGLPARAGEVAKVVLARRTVRRRGGDVGVAQVAGSIAAEHLVSTLAWAVVAAVLCVALPTPGAVRAGAIGIGVACTAATAIVAWRPPARRLIRGRRAMAALAEAWAAAHEGLRALRRPGALGVVVGAGAAQWLAQWAAIWLTLCATGLGAAGPAGAGMVLVTLTLAHAVPLLPGGAGTFQMGAMLPLTGAYGVEPEAALAFGLVLQMGETAVNVGLGFVFLAREGLAQTEASRAAGLPSVSRRMALRNAMRSSSV
jgi:Lysylphosphatidylglycerol synthase TM region